MKKKTVQPRQLNFEALRTTRREHGGTHSHGKRRSFRPLSTKHSLHITLKSDFAIGGRCLLRHRKMIERMMRKAAYLFRVRVYNHAICGNHLHLLIKGNSREDLQNFFRVFAGHTAQNILRDYPLLPKELDKRRSFYEGGAPQKGKRAVPCKKNRRKFWLLLIYSRAVTWGREYRTVRGYIEQNTLETLRIIAYTPRHLANSKRRKGTPKSLEPRRT